MGLEAKTFSSTLASLADPLTVAKYLMAYLAETVFPAPDSPLTMMDWFRSSLKHKYTLIPSCSLKDAYFLHPQPGNNPSTVDVSSTAQGKCRWQAGGSRLPSCLPGWPDRLPAGRSSRTDTAGTAQPGSRAASGTCLRPGICYCYSLRASAPTSIQSLWYSAPLNQQCSLVKITNAILQMEKSTAESATETFRPSDLITSLSQNCSESEKFKHGCSGHR